MLSLHFLHQLAEVSAPIYPHQVYWPEKNNKKKSVGHIHREKEAYFKPLKFGSHDGGESNLKSVAQASKLEIQIRFDVAVLGLNSTWQQTGN